VASSQQPVDHVCDGVDQIEPRVRLPRNVDIDERDRLRFAFLQLLYERDGGRRRGSSNMWSIGAELGLDRRQAAAVFEYLKDAGLTEYRAAGGIGLTYEGICAIGETMREPEAAREYFPEINIIALGNMINSQIQQRTRGTSQRVAPTVETE
jgi:hypothetical protein